MISWYSFGVIFLFIQTNLFFKESFFSISNLSILSTLDNLYDISDLFLIFLGSIDIDLLSIEVASKLPLISYISPLLSLILSLSFKTKREAMEEIINREGLLKYLGVNNVYRIKRIW